MARHDRKHGVGRRSDDQQTALRHKIKELIALLKAIHFTGTALEGAFDAADQRLIGGPYTSGEKKPGSASTFYRLFGFRGNAPKFLGTRATLDIEARHIECVWIALRALGFDVGSASISETADRWQVFLDRMVAAAKDWPHSARSALTEPAPVISHPAWRFVERSARVSAILERLEAVGAMAIVGLPGIGKTILARQVAERARSSGQKIIEREAGYWLRLTPSVSAMNWPTGAHYVGLWAEIMREIATLPGWGSGSHAERAAFRSRIHVLCQRWSVDSANLQKEEKSFIEMVGARPTPEALADAIIAHSANFRNPLLVADIAELVRLVTGEALVVVDDVLRIGEARSTVQALFGRSRDGRLSPLRFLVTSQRNADSLAFLVGAEAAAASAKLIDGYDWGFARAVIAAWATPGEDDVTTDEAATRIARFRTSAMDTAADESAALDRVIAHVGGHALALAGLASVWRYGGHRRGFWTKAFASIQAKPTDLLHLQVIRDPGGVIDERHKDVLQALRLAWSLLDDGGGDWEATRDRFLDLAITSPSEPIDENVFVAFWKRVARGPRGERLASAIAAKKSPLRRLEAASFVRAADGRAGIFTLHGLHRILIEQELGPAGLGTRHRDLLSAFGMIDPRGIFHLDEEKHFTVQEGRTVIWPNLGDQADELDNRDVGHYLLKSLPDHVRSAESESPGEYSADLVTTFRFLQARLDFVEDGGSGPDETGNVACLMSALDGSATGSIATLRRILRRAGEAIAQDRRQLASQILARIPTKVDRRLDRLRAGARLNAPRRALVPRFPFLAEREPNLIGLRVSHLGFGGAIWVDRVADSQAVLTWSGRMIEWWNPETGSVGPTIDHGSRIERAVWIADAVGAPAILSWSWICGAIRLWDAETRALRTDIAYDGNVADPFLIPDAPGGPAILSWSIPRGRAIHLWDAVTGAKRLHLRHGTRPVGLPEEFAAKWISTADGGPAILSWSSADNTVRLWDVESRRERVQIPHCETLGGATWIRNAFGSPAVLSWSVGGTIRLWNPETACMRTQMGPPATGNPSGRLSYLASGACWIEQTSIPPAILWWSNLDLALRVWDPATGQEIARLLHDDGVCEVTWIADAPAGPAILSRAGNAAYVWDAKTHQRRARIEHDRAVLGARWVSEGIEEPAILTWSDDSTARLSDARTGTELARLPHRDGVSGAHWVPYAFCGPVILTWSAYVGGGLRLWDPAVPIARGTPSAP